MNIKKVVGQHLEMEQFFSGFVPKSKVSQWESQNMEDDMAVTEKTAELEKIAE